MSSRKNVRITRSRPKTNPRLEGLVNLARYPDVYCIQCGSNKKMVGRLENINDNKMNNSTSLNPEFFAEKFELNDDL